MNEPRRDKDLLERLKKNKLIVDKVRDVGPYANGFSIAKPKNVKGNYREEYQVLFGKNKIVCDAQSVFLYPKDGNEWLVELWEYMPGPGPGDFRESFSSLDLAISYIIDYYFGAPERMNPPELLMK